MKSIKFTKIKETFTVIISLIKETFVDIVPVNNEKFNLIMSSIINNIKRLVYFVSEKYAIFTNHINSGSANSVMTVGIVMLGIVILSTTVSTHTLNVAYAEIKIQELKLLNAKEETYRLVEIEREKASAEKMVMKYQLRIEEARAAANPYIVSPQQTQNQQPQYPVNVFIDTLTPRYVIETSDGATEIAISTIKIKGVRYSPEQRKLMTMAFYIGKTIGFPETIQSLLLQETLAGAIGDRIGDINLPIGKRSYGVMQIKVATARKVLKQYKKLIPKYFPKRRVFKRLRDEEIIIRLIQDDEFNIKLAALNFNIHRNKSKSWAQAVVAYNTGQGAANSIKEPKKHIYYRYILKRLISEVRPFNKKTNLTM